MRDEARARDKASRNAEMFSVAPSLCGGNWRYRKHPRVFSDYCVVDFCKLALADEHETLHNSMKIRLLHHSGLSMQ